MQRDFEVGCSLDYWVHRPATLVFNIQAAELPRQVVRDEALTFTPASAIECATMPDGNRLVRVTPSAAGSGRSTAPRSGWTRW